MNREALDNDDPPVCKADPRRGPGGAVVTLHCCPSYPCWMRCPVCGGNGQVPNGFYEQTGGRWITASTTPEKCRACDGRGIVR